MKQKIQLLWPMLMVMLVLSSSLTGFLTWLNVGFGADFLSKWRHAFLIGLCVIAPTGALIMWLVNQLVTRFFARQSPLTQKIALACLMGALMEFALAFITTASNMGFADGVGEFFSQWMRTYIKALPLGICVGVLMSFVIKPMLEKRAARIAAA